MRPRLSRLAAALTLASAAMACGVVLDVPSEVSDVEAVADRLCQCPVIVEQPQNVLDACLEAKRGANEADFMELADAGCDSCKKAQPCYGQLTGAGKAGDSCGDSSECESFACCFDSLSQPLGLPLGVCCDVCVGCATLLAAGEAPSLFGACMDSLPAVVAVLDCATDVGLTNCPEDVLLACSTDQNRPYTQ